MYIFIIIILMYIMFLLESSHNSLIKMVFASAKRNNGLPTWDQLEHAVLRNFGGLETADPLKVFSRHFLTTEEQFIVSPTLFVIFIFGSFFSINRKH